MNKSNVVKLSNTKRERVVKDVMYELHDALDLLGGFVCSMLKGSKQTVSAAAFNIGMSAHTLARIADRDIEDPSRLWLGTYYKVLRGFDNTEVFRPNLLGRYRMAKRERRPAKAKKARAA